MRNFTKHNWIKVTTMVMVCAFLSSETICTGELYAKNSHLRKENWTSVPTNTEIVSAERGIRMLMVDDDYGFIQLAALVLASEDPSLVIETARDGREAWKKFQANPFDIVTTDNDMPFVNGSELSRKIKELKPETYIIMQSGGDPQNAKIDDFLDKGNIELFYEAIGKAKAAVESRLTSAAKPLTPPINSLSSAVTASL